MLELRAREMANPEKNPAHLNHNLNQEQFPNKFYSWDWIL